MLEVEPNSEIVACAVDVRREFFSTWLNQFSWRAFVTGTFAVAPTHAEGAFRAFERYLHVVGIEAARARPSGRAFRWQRKPFAACFHEVGAQGRGHLHALVGNSDPLPAFCGVRIDVETLDRKRRGRVLTRCCLLHLWNHIGNARAVEFDPTQGASHYLTKYSCKDAGVDSWRLYGEFENGGFAPDVFFEIKKLLQGNQNGVQLHLHPVAVERNLFS